MIPLNALVAGELATPVDPRVTAVATAIAAQYPGAARAVLFYGSCLRETQLDGLMLDFYLIVSDYNMAYDRHWLATANRMIPPNVFPFAHDNLAAKYAVLDAADFARLCSPAADNVSVWARFAQPTRLVWRADDAATDAVIAAVSSAAPTLFALAAPLAPDKDILRIWHTGFAQTYQCELRAERNDRSGSIVDADPGRYAKFGTAIDTGLSVMSRDDAARMWKRLKRRGKYLSVLRLAKASLTFSGGIDYLAWKINRHAGTAIIIRPWQRRWPLIAALFLVPRLLAKGAVK